MRFEAACLQKFLLRTDLDLADFDVGTAACRVKSVSVKGQKGFDQVFDSVQKSEMKNEWEKVTIRL